MTSLVALCLQARWPVDWFKGVLLLMRLEEVGGEKASSCAYPSSTEPITGKESAQIHVF